MWLLPLLCGHLLACQRQSSHSDAASWLAALQVAERASLRAAAEILALVLPHHPMHQELGRRHVMFRTVLFGVSAKEVAVEDLKRRLLQP